MSTHLSIIIGPMFSGKSSELIRRVKRAKIGKKKVLVLKPIIDTRYSVSRIESHDGLAIDCINSELSLNIFSINENYDLIAIDEAQFFKGLYNFVKKQLNLKKEIIVAGLDGDYRRKKFGEILDLIPLSNEVIKLSAICNKCGKEAYYTFRKTNEEKQVIIGEKDIYEARCWDCWQKGMEINNYNKELLLDSQ